MSTEVEERIKNLEEQVRNISQAVAAVADDMLRACFMFEELSKAGLIPSPLPWELCTLMVELQHALRAKREGETGDQPIDLIIQELQERIVTLRASLAKEGHG